jgi:transaldolase
MSDRLRRLHAECGQSPWLDNLKRDLLTSGELARVRDSGVRGLTSNPTIFQKAIQGSVAYDEQFRRLLAAGCSISECFWEMVLADIVGALDVFAPVYDESSGGDGFVSVEVDPHLANDTAGTAAAALDLWSRVDRPNLMVKIPATRAGLPAIRAAIAAGVNVNVTLIFGLERYRDVMEAYVSGLEDRMAAGGEIAGVASVASFFVSRVDTEIDARLETIGTSDALALRGRAAVAQARLAYADFRRVFTSERWSALASAGAAVQRPLWASTSTKNPAYPDTLYVDSLIGPDTVNTLPDATLLAFADHGTPRRTVDEVGSDAREVWSGLAEVGVDVAAVADKLEREGLDSFVASFDELLAALRDKSAGWAG